VCSSLPAPYSYRWCAGSPRVRFDNRVALAPRSPPATRRPQTGRVWGLDPLSTLIASDSLVDCQANACRAARFRLCNLASALALGSIWPFERWIVDIDGYYCRLPMSATTSSMSARSGFSLASVRSSSDHVMQSNASSRLHRTTPINHRLLRRADPAEAFTACFARLAHNESGASPRTAQFS
jgi:hypothetical protein